MSLKPYCSRQMYYASALVPAANSRHLQEPLAEQTLLPRLEQEQGGVERVGRCERAVGLKEVLDGAEGGKVLQDGEKRGSAVRHDAGGKVCGLVEGVVLAEPLEERCRKPESSGEREEREPLAVVEEEGGEGEEEGGEKDRVGRFAEKGENGDGWELNMKQKRRRGLMGGVKHTLVET